MDKRPPLSSMELWRYAAATLGAIALGLLYHGSARTVELWIGEQSFPVRSHARTVEALLRDQGITLGPYDQTRPPPTGPLTPMGDQPVAVYIDHAFPVLVETAEGVEWTLATSTTARNLLLNLGISLFPGDRVVIDGLLASGVGSADRVPTSHLAVRAGSRFELVVDGRAQELYSSAPTLGEALWENGIELFEGDSLAPGPETPMAQVQSAQLRRSKPVTIIAAGARLQLRSSAVTVGEALQQAGLSLQGLDYAIPDEQGPLPADRVIRVVRVEDRIEVTLQPLAFQIAYQPMPEAEIDTQTILQAGAYGVQAERDRLRLEDGVEVERSGQGVWVAKEPSDQIVGYGTQIVIRTVDTPDGSIDYWRAVQMYATSYSPSRAGVPEDSPWFGITASGKPATKGLVAIDRSLIPFGTRMYVPGYGFAEAADTGGGVKGRWIDLGYDDDNYVPWHQYVTVYFLAPAPPASNIVWIFP